jgi:hypothetical protein
MPRPTALLLAALGAAMSVSVGMASPASATTTLAAPAGTYDALDKDGTYSHWGSWGVAWFGSAC